MLPAILICVRAREMRELTDRTGESHFSEPTTFIIENKIEGEGYGLEKQPSVTMRLMTVMASV